MGDLGFPSYSTHVLYTLQETSNRQEPNTDNLHYNSVLINMKVAKEMGKYLVVTKEPETMAVLARDIAGLSLVALIVTLLLRKVQALDSTLQDMRSWDIWSRLSNKGLTIQANKLPSKYDCDKNV